MSDFFDFLFREYQGYSTLFIVLEITAAIFGALSVIFSARNNILVYPTGLISTGIFIYIFYDGSLYGDMLINSYYFYMSIYGWLLWSRKDENHKDLLKISTLTPKDTLNSIAIFIGSVIFVAGIYIATNKYTYWWAYVDTFVTGLFFVGMWLLARRKIENWLFLLAGDIIAVPLYFLKGLTFTSILTIFLIIVAVIGFFVWRKILHTEKQAT